MFCDFRTRLSTELGRSRLTDDVSTFVTETVQSALCAADFQGPKVHSS